MHLPNHRWKNTDYHTKQQSEIRNNSKRQSGKHDNRGINPSKSGNKVLRLGLLFRSLFDKLKNLRYGRVLKALCGLYTKKTFSVNTTGNNSISRKNGSRYGLPCKGCRIHHTFSTPHNPVHGYLFSRFNEKNISDFHLIRVNRFYASIFPFYIRILRNDVHQLFNRRTTPPDCIALEEFSDLVKHHYRNSFRKLTCKKSTDGGNGHKQSFVKRAAVFNPKKALSNHIISTDKIGNKIEWQKEKRMLIENGNQLHFFHQYQK